MKSYSLQVIDMSDILDELFPEDNDSRDQIIDAITTADWTFGGNAYSLIRMDEFMEFLMTCVDNDICEALTRDKINEIWRLFQIQNPRASRTIRDGVPDSVPFVSMST